jgi:hypothetical protein
MYRKRVAATLVAGVAVAMFGAINPATASEAAPAAGSVRMWEDPNYTGSPVRRRNTRQLPERV